MPHNYAHTAIAVPVPPILERLPFRRFDLRLLAVFLAAAATAGSFELHLSLRQMRAGLAKKASPRQVDEETARLCAAGVLELLAEPEGVGGAARRWRIDPTRIRELCAKEEATSHG